jgi:hypothetical protein
LAGNPGINIYPRGKDSYFISLKMNSEELQREFEIPTPEQHKANVLQRVKEKEAQIFRKQTAKIVDVLNSSEVFNPSFTLDEPIGKKTWDLFYSLGYQIIGAGSPQHYHIEPK